MRQLLTIAGLLLLVYACKKDDDETQRKFTSFKLDSLIVLAENPNAVLTPANLTDDDPNNDYATMTITATGNHDETITFTLVAQGETFTPGIYPSTEQGNSMFIKFSNGNNLLLADDTYGGLSFEIRSLQDSLMEASFEGDLEDPDSLVSDKPLREGFLRAIVTTGN